MSLRDVRKGQPEPLPLGTNGLTWMGEGWLAEPISRNACRRGAVTSTVPLTIPPSLQAPESPSQLVPATQLAACFQWLMEHCPVQLC